MIPKNYLTMDVNILLGLVNTALRNGCEDLEDLVKSHSLDEVLLRDRLESVGLVYLAEINQFRPKDSQPAVD